MRPVTNLKFQFPKLADKYYKALHALNFPLEHHKVIYNYSLYLFKQILFRLAPDNRTGEIHRGSFNIQTIYL